MILQGNVGQQSLGDGTPNVFARFSRFASLLVDENQGRYYEQASRGKMFSASNQAARAISSLSASATGFILNNPIGSNVQISLLDVCCALATAPAGVSNLHYEANTAMQAVIPVTLTAETVINNQIGNPAVGVAQVWRVATLATAPVAIRALGGGPVASGSLTSPYIRDEIAGQIVLLPGTCILPGYLTTAISLVTSMAWCENPL